ncbi:hypothetical protein HDU86_001714 [Geranomyces michiganensis]|nr:hypothetical protein HDU86_001714 [Geranomyces michiganensis]
MSNLLDLLGSNPTNERLELVTRLLEAEASAKQNEIRLKELELSARAAPAMPTADFVSDTSMPSVAVPAVDQVAQKFSNLGFDPLPISTPSNNGLQFSFLPTTFDFGPAVEETLSDFSCNPPFDPSVFNLPSTLYSNGKQENEDEDHLDFNLFGGNDNGLSILDELLRPSPKLSEDDFDYTFPPAEIFQFRGTPTTAASDSHGSASPQFFSSPSMSTTSRNSTSPVPLPQAPSPSNPIAVPYRNFPGRAAKKRHVPKVDVQCRVCTKRLGVAHLYTEPNEAAAFAPDFACKECEHGNAWDDKKMAKLIFSKKRYAVFEPREAPVRCDICKGAACAGGFRKLNVEEWSAPGFAVEFNCVSRLWSWRPLSHRKMET